MYRSYLLSGFLLLSAATLSACAGSAPTARLEAARQSVQAVQTQLMEAFARGDMEAVATYYTEDAQLMPPNAPPVTGRADIADFWKAGRALGIHRLTLETTELTGGDGQATEIGRYTLYGEADAVIDEGKYTVIWREVDDAWRLHREMWNTNRPVVAAETETAGDVVGAHTRAAQGEPVLVMLNHIQPTRRTQFEQFLQHVIEAGRQGVATDQMSEQQLRAFRGMRVLYPGGLNENGTLTYVFMLDPYVEGAEYDIEALLKMAYTEDEARRYFQLFTESLAEPQEGIFMVQGPF